MKSYEESKYRHKGGLKIDTFFFAKRRYLQSNLDSKVNGLNNSLEKSPRTILLTMRFRLTVKWLISLRLVHI